MMGIKAVEAEEPRTPLIAADEIDRHLSRSFITGRRYGCTQSPVFILAIATAKHPYPGSARVGVAFPRTTSHDRLAFWEETFGDDPVPVIDPEAAAAMEIEAEDDDLTGASFILALLYLALILPLISLGVFFFKRLSINRLLRRVVIAGGSAVGLVVLSAGYASVFGS